MNTKLQIFNDKKVKYNKRISIINGPVHIKCAGSFFSSKRPPGGRPGAGQAFSGH